MRRCRPTARAIRTTTASLQSIVCQTAQACTAVGNYNGTSGGGGQFGLIDSESAGSWSAQAAPQPAAAAADQEVSVLDLTCPTLGPCAAIGSYEAAGPPQTNPAFLLEQSPAGAWSAQDVPLPSGSGTGANTFNDLAGISCAAVCEAAGQVELESGQFVGLLEQLSNGAWTPSVAPVPADAGSGGAGLNGVSCTFDGICTTVGSCNKRGQRRAATDRHRVGLHRHRHRGTTTGRQSHGLGQRRDAERGVVRVGHPLRRRRLLPQQHELGP